MTKFAFLLTVLWVLSPALAIATIHAGTINGDVAQATTCAVGTTQALGTVTYDDVSGLFSWSYTYGDNSPTFTNGALFGGGSETLAHFHGPALPGVTAGVQVGISPLGTPNSGSATISGAQGTDLLAELWYLNIHSTSCGGGEVRGQVLFPSVPAVPSSSIYGLAALLLGLVGTTTLAVYRRQRAS